MISNAEMQQDAHLIRSRGNTLVPFLTIMLGSLLVLVSFLFFNWNPSFTPYTHTPNPFLNGPGVFQDAIHYYGTPAIIWIWMTPLVAIIALILACAGFLWRSYLLPLASIPGSIGFLLLARFILTGEWWNYGNYGYWLALLGMLLILGGGLGARGMLSQKEVAGTYNLLLTYCLLIGSILVIASFFLPWLDLQTSSRAYTFQQGFYSYRGFPVTGAELASGFFPYMQQFYRQITPEVFWLLWLVPLIGLIGVMLFSSWATDLLCQEVSWSNDSQRVATTGRESKSLIEIHDVATKKVLQTFGGDTVSDEDSYRAVSWSPDNRYLAASGLGAGSNNRESFLRIWEVSSNKRIVNTYYAPESYLTTGVIWSPDGTRVATLGDASGVNIWKAPFWEKPVVTYVGTGGPFYSLAWSRDGTYIASGDGNVVRVWNTTTGETLFSYLGHQNEVQSISWSPRGNLIASTSGDDIRIWRPF